MSQYSQNFMINALFTRNFLNNFHFKDSIFWGGFGRTEQMKVALICSSEIFCDFFPIRPQTLSSWTPFLFDVSSGLISWWDKLAWSPLLQSDIFNIFNIFNCANHHQSVWHYINSCKELINLARISNIWIFKTILDYLKSLKIIIISNNI